MKFALSLLVAAATATASLSAQGHDAKAEVLGALDYRR